MSVKCKLRPQQTTGRSLAGDFQGLAGKSYAAMVRTPCMAPSVSFEAGRIPVGQSGLAACSERGFEAHDECGGLGLPRQKLGDK